MKNKNEAAKYFTQKNIGPVDIVAGVLLVAAIILILINDGFARVYYLGLALFPAAVLVFSRTSKISDSDYESIVRRIASDNEIPLSGEYVSAEYDLERETRRLGRDQRARSDVFVVARFGFASHKCRLSRWEINVPENSAKLEEYEFDASAKPELVKGEAVISQKKRETAVIAIPAEGGTVRIPVSPRSTDGDEILERFSRL